MTDRKPDVRIESMRGHLRRVINATHALDAELDAHVDDCTVDELRQLSQLATDLREACDLLAQRGRKLTDDRFDVTY